MKKIFCCFNTSEITQSTSEIKGRSSTVLLTRQTSRPFSTDGLGWNECFDYECRRLSKILDETTSECLVLKSNFEKSSVQQFTKQPSLLGILPKIQLDPSSVVSSAKSMASMIYDQFSPVSLRSDYSVRTTSSDLHNKMNGSKDDVIEKICMRNSKAKVDVSIRARTRLVVQSFFK